MSTVHSKTKVAGRLIVVAGFLALVLSGCAANGAAQAGVVKPSQADESTDPTASTEPTEAVAAEPTGCPETDATMPDDADSAEIADIDGDGKNDTEWYSEATVPFTYGITTASGGTYTLEDDLAGPNTHSGWTAALHNGVVVTVLDDGRGATLHAFVDCAFVTPIGVDGKAYTFDMQNLHDNGTGVGCLEVDGGLELNGLQVTENRDDSYSLLATGITVSDDGSSAVNGYTAVSASLPADDRRVAEAQTSSCADAPVVSTSGR
ncbi:hypothetical protein [Cryobacterium arcticum]|uniref:Lipoprotein n=1 Tax=Cryobacterium arcticum TaxID=670052 RepID=A0A318A5X6_9MICO|nr:hypothetical protein [Cryobacterium arcticum]PXA72761.1 hypothetical protein CTB96_01255 [Cryobacterium arcticum]